MDIHFEFFNISVFEYKCLSIALNDAKGNLNAKI